MKNNNIKEIEEGIITIRSSADIGDATIVKIPSTIEKIQPWAFKRCTSLEEVDLSLATNLKIIDGFAFEGCQSLKVVKFPPSIEIIEGNAFDGCNSLEEIDLSLATNLKRIDEYAFNGCESLKVVKYPPSIELIGKRAFDGCNSLEEVDLSLATNLKRIEYRTFYKCESLRMVKFPPSIEVIEKEAFWECGIEYLDLSEVSALTDIEESAFALCESLKQIKFSSSIKHLKKWAFAKCGNLENIDFSEATNLTYMGYGCFVADCSLREIILPENLTTLEEGVFGNCSNLRKIEIPDTVEKIDNYCFDETKLRSIVLPASLKQIPYLGSIGYLKSIDFSKVTKVKDLDTCIVSNHKVKEVIIPMGVEIIDEGCLNFQKIFLPPTIQEIGACESIGHIEMYCYSSELNELDTLTDNEDNVVTLYVLPDYLQDYLDQCEAEGIDEEKLKIEPMPGELIYLYDN